MKVIYEESESIKAENLIKPDPKTVNNACQEMTGITAASLNQKRNINDKTDKENNGDTKKLKKDVIRHLSIKKVSTMQISKSNKSDTDETHDDSEYSKEKIYSSEANKNIESSSREKVYKEERTDSKDIYIHRKTEHIYKGSSRDNKDEKKTADTKEYQEAKTKVETGVNAKKLNNKKKTEDNNKKSGVISNIISISMKALNTATENTRGSESQAANSFLAIVVVGALLFALFLPIIFVVSNPLCELVMDEFHKLEIQIVFSTMNNRYNQIVSQNFLQEYGYELDVNTDEFSEENSIEATAELLNRIELTDTSSINWRQVLALYYAMARSRLNDPKPLIFDAFHLERADNLEDMLFGSDEYIAMYSMDATYTEYPDKNEILIDIECLDPEEYMEAMDFTDSERKLYSSILSMSDNQYWMSLLTFTEITDSGLSAMALSQLGNYCQIYDDWFGCSYDTQWCAVFVSYCAYRCGYIDDDIMCRSASCLEIMNFHKARDEYYDSSMWRDGLFTPQPGDLVFYKTGTSISHIGIVTKVTMGIQIEVVSGNSYSGNLVGNTPQTRYVAQCSRFMSDTIPQENSRYICGFARPDYPVTELYTYEGFEL